MPKTSRLRKYIQSGGGQQPQQKAAGTSRLREYLERNREQERRNPESIAVTRLPEPPNLEVRPLPPQPSLNVIDSATNATVEVKRPPIQPRGPSPSAPIPVVGAYGTPAPRPAYTGPGMVFNVDDETAASFGETARQYNEGNKKLKESITGKNTRVEDFTKGALRAFPRATVSVGSTIKPVEGRAELVPATPLARFIFGEDPIGDIPQEGEKFGQVGALGAIKLQEKIDGTKLSEEDKQAVINDVKKYKWLTVPLGLLSVGSDLVPGVGGAKKQITKEAAEQLIKKYGLEVANEIVATGSKEVAERALKSEADNFIKEFTLGNADTLSKAADNSFLNKPIGIYNKPNRLQGEGYSFKEAKTGLAENGKDIPGRIVLGKNDDGKVILKDGTHLLEAYRQQGLTIPPNKVALEDGLTIEDIKPAKVARPPRTSVSKQGQFPDRAPEATPLKTGQQEPPVSISQKQFPSASPEAQARNIDEVAYNPVKDNVIKSETRKTVNEIIEQNRGTLRQGAKELGTDVIDDAKLPLYKQVYNATSELFTKTRETFEDSWIRVKKLVNDPNTKAGDISDPYLRKTLFSGRVHTRLEEAKKSFSKIDNDLVQTSKRVNIPDKQLAEEVSDYLVARHAPERNKELADAFAAGINDKQAAEIIAQIEASPHGKEVVRIANELQKVNKQVLTTLRDGQVITPKLYKTLTETYKNHVPLNRILENDDDIARSLTEAGFSVKKTGIQKAKGSTRDIADVWTNIKTNLDQAIVRSEKNRVDLATLAFARENKHLGLFSEIPVNKARSADPSILFLYEGGKKRALKINDPHLAAVLRNVNVQHLPALFRFVQTVTRFYASVATRFNPDFLLPNKMRDLQELMTFSAAQKEIGFKGAGKTIVRDPASVKDITDYIFNRNTPGAKLYEQMRLDGGTTGGLALSTRGDVQVSLDKIRKLNRSNPRKAVEAIFKSVDNANTIIEDSSRLSLYKTALENGLSRERAAALAKEATINFNKMGTAGPVINSMWMFSNASLQGSAKMLRAMKNPKVAGTVALVIGGGVIAVNQYNDSIDPEWRSKVSEWDRMNNFAILIPSDEGIKYFTIPVSWGLKPIKSIAEYSYDVVEGHTTPGKALEGSLAATLDAYNPLGGTDLLSTATPTILDLPVDIARNKAWHGGKIFPDYDQSAADVTKSFDSLQDTASGKFFTNLATTAYDQTEGKIDVSPATINYVFEQLIGGTGRSGSRVYNTISGAVQGEPVPAKELPITNRFYKSKPQKDIEEEGLPKDPFYKINADVKKNKSVERMKSEQLYRETLGNPDKAAGARKLQELQKSGELTPEVTKQLYEQFKKANTGLSEFENTFKKSPIESRARYLQEIITNPDIPKEKKAQIIQHLSDKKLITKKVMQDFIKLVQP